MSFLFLFIGGGITYFTIFFLCSLLRVFLAILDLLLSELLHIWSFFFDLLGVSLSFLHLLFSLSLLFVIH
jgi:hypothetical protein